MNTNRMQKVYLVTDEGVVSHGVNNETGKNVIMPCEPIGRFEGVQHDHEGSYIMMEAKR